MKKVILHFSLTLFSLLSLSLAKDFNVPSKLKFLIQEVIKNSKYIKAQNLQLEATKIEKKITKRSKGPNLKLSSSLSYGKIYMLSNRNWQTSLPFSLSLVLSYTLYDPNYKLNLESSTLNYKNAQISFLKEKINLEYKFINLYLDYLSTINTLKLEKQNLEIAKKIYTIAIKKYKSGVLDQESLINYLIFLKDKEKKIKDLEDKIKILKSQIKNYIDLPQIPILNFPDPPQKINVRPKDLNKEALKVSIKSTELEIKKIKNTLKPTFRLSASGRFNNDYKVKRDSSLSFSIGINVDWLLFDNYQTKYRILQKEKKLLSLQNQLADEKKNFEMNLHTSYLNYLNLLKQYYLQSKITALYQQIFTAKQKKFEAGQISLEDLLNTQKDYLSSEELKIKLFYQVWKAYFDYLKTSNVDILNIL